MERVPRDFNEVLDGIHLLKQNREMTWLDSILEFCETNEYRVEEVGYILRENKNFLKIIEDDFIRNNHMRGIVDEKSDLLSDWI